MGDCLQDSDERKQEWLEDARKRIPVGTRVRVVRSDLDEYIGITGQVIGHDIGYYGEWPLVTVAFDATVMLPDGPIKRDGFFCDGLDDDEIEKL